MTLFVYSFLAFPWLAFIARRSSRGTAAILAVLLFCAMLPGPVMPFFGAEYGEAPFFGTEYGDATWLHYFAFLWSFGFAFLLYAVNGHSFGGTFIFLLVVCSTFLATTFWGVLLIPFLWLYLGFAAGIVWLIERFLKKEERNEK